MSLFSRLAAVSPILHSFPLSLQSSLWNSESLHHQHLSPPASLQLLRPLLVLHALHNPPARLLSILIRLLLILHRLLHLREIVRDIHALVHGGTLLNRLQPCLHFWERSRFHARPLAPIDPREDADVAERVLVADEVCGFAVRDVVGLALGGETVVEDLIEAFGFGLVAVDGVFDLLGGVCGQLGICGWGMGLARFGTYI